jgi:putative flavoprotein involved in K+ transport
MTTLDSAIERRQPAEAVTQRFDVIVIGGGQCGLSVGHYLARAGLRFIILDERDRVGDIWRSRWASMRLFTPARQDGLPGMRFPAPPHAYPARDEMAEFLENYAATWALPVETGVHVDGLWPAGDGKDWFVVTAGDRRYVARQVVVATGIQGRARIPDFAAALDPGIRQLHSRDYRNQDQLQDGDVLVVGAGNSGAEIALESAHGHRTILAGPDTGQIPFPIDSRRARVIFRVMVFVARHVLTVDTPIGRKLAPKIRTGHAAPLARVKQSDLQAAGVERTLAHVNGVRRGLPELDDGRVLDVRNVVWCTGFRHDFGWIHLPVFDEDGYPLQVRGVVPAAPGLYFIGLPFLHSFSSMIIAGVGRDAAYIARRVAARADAMEKVPAAPASKAA